MEKEVPVIGTCRKCDTTESELFEYRAGFWICKAGTCWDEEVERDSGRHIEKNEKLKDYRRLVAGTNI